MCVVCDTAQTQNCHSTDAKGLASKVSHTQLRTKHPKSSGCSNQGPSETNAVCPVQNDSLKGGQGAVLESPWFLLSFRIHPWPCLQHYCTAERFLLKEELLTDAHACPDCYFCTTTGCKHAVNIFFPWIKVLACIPFLCTQESQCS